jgi:hypothetical protein
MTTHVENLDTTWMAEASELLIELLERDKVCHQGACDCNPLQLCEQALSVHQNKLQFVQNLYNMMTTDPRDPPLKEETVCSLKADLQAMVSRKELLEKIISNITARLKARNIAHSKLNEMSVQQLLSF